MTEQPAQLPLKLVYHVSNDSHVSHGSFREPTRFRMIQREYAGSDMESSNPGFIERLEIIDPPAGSGRHIVHQFEEGRGSRVFEFSGEADSKAAYHLFFSNYYREAKRRILEMSSFVRRTAYRGNDKPWFYK